MPDMQEVRARIATTLESSAGELGEMASRVKEASLGSEPNFWEDAAAALDRLSSLADVLSDLAAKVEKQARNPGTVRFIGS